MDHEDVVVKVHLAAHAPADAVDLMASELWAEGATAVEVVTADKGTTLVAGYPTAEAARQVAARLAGPLGAVAETVADDGWRDAWRSWAQPVSIGPRLVVVPAWVEVPVGEDRLGMEDRLGIEIDPGPCFGSGTHATTRMLLRWLGENEMGAAEVIDVGTGSGVLSVAAALLGARRVVAVDIDPAAVEATKDNAARNGVNDRVHPSTAAVADLPSASGDVVLVNVTAGVHAAIGEDCARLVRSGGSLVVSGLLPGQWDHVAPVYRELTEVGRLALDGWCGAYLERRTSA